MYNLCKLKCQYYMATGALTSGSTELAIVGLTDFPTELSMAFNAGAEVHRQNHAVNLDWMIQTIYHEGIVPIRIP